MEMLMCKRGDVKKEGMRGQDADRDKQTRVKERGSRNRNTQTHRG